MNSGRHLEAAIVADMIEEHRFYQRKLAEGGLAQQERLEYIGLYLESIAALEEAGEQIEKQRLPREEVEQCLASLDAQSLMDAADELLETIDQCLADSLNEEKLWALSEQLLQHLQLRHRFERRWRGARSYYPDLSLSEDQNKALVYFDSLVRPMVWALSILNEKREGYAQLQQPPRRYWWWIEGIEVSWEAVRRAEEVALLMEKYPSFAQYFERLRQIAYLLLNYRLH